MVYESDFYTTRRPYRTSPAISSYTISGAPSRQVRVLPGLGKVHVTYTYDRVVPYVGHKRLTVVTSPPPKVYSTRPSVLQREFERIENKLRPWYAYSATNRYLNSDSAARSYYYSYPITGYNYSYSLNLPTSCYLPKVYRWYYSWPRVYSSYWPYYRSYLTSYLRNYYLSDYYPSSYYWSSYLPYYKSLDYDFSELENKIDNLRRTIYLDYPTPIKAVDYPYYPYTYRTYRPLTLYYDYYWPLSSLNRYSDYWPYYPYYRYLYYKYTLPSDRYYHLKGIFDDETRLIRAQTASLLKRIHNPVPRVQRFSYPIGVPTKYYDDGLPARYSNDYYIHKLLTTSPRNPKVEYTTYYTEPVRKYIGHGNLACVSYAGERAYNRRPFIYLYEDPLKSDIQLMSFYINKFRQEKAQSGGATITEPTKVPLSPARPSRKFSANKHENVDVSQEMQNLREARAARLAFIQDEAKIERKVANDKPQNVRKEDEQKLAEEKARAAAERAAAEEKARQEEEARLKAQAKKEEAERKAELARQEKLAAQAAAERAAELERQAELARQEELAKQAEIEKARKLEEEQLRLEEEKRLEEEARAEEERKQLIRLEELARQAEEEREAELARQAEELAELARQEAELAEQAKKEAEEAELARQQEELAELERQEAELAELERKEKELAELAKQEAEAARRDAELAELAREEAELAELERQQAELDALEAEAKALEADNQPELPEENVIEDPEEPIVDEVVTEETAPEEITSEQTEEEEDEDARKQREMDELVQQKYELAELERQQAELDALEAEAKALAEGIEENGAADYDEEEPAIAEDTPVQSDVEAEE